MNRLWTIVLAWGCFVAAGWLDSRGSCAENETQQSAALAKIDKLGGVTNVDGKDAKRPVTVLLSKREHATETLRLLKSVDNLRELTLCEWTTDETLQQLDGLDSLVVLNIGVNGGGKFTDAGLRHVAGLTHLQELMIDGGQITDAGLKDLEGLSDLRHLSFYFNTTITGAGLEHLKAAKNLRCVELMCCSKIDDAAIQHLVGMPSLQELWLTCSGHVTDDSIESLRKLSGMKKLVAPQLSGEAKAKLRQALPACEIK
jgi:hypothetical protein